MKLFYSVDTWTVASISTKLVRAESLSDAVEVRVNAMRERGYAVTRRGEDWSEMTNPTTGESIRLYGFGIV